MRILNRLNLRSAKVPEGRSALGNLKAAIEEEGTTKCIPLEIFDGQLFGEEKAAGGTGVAWHGAQFA